MIDVTKGILLGRLALDIIAGDRQDGAAVARELMAHAIDLIPVDRLKDFLTERDKTFADLAADVAEQIKLEKTEP